MKLSSVAAAVGIPKKVSRAPNLFGDDEEPADGEKDKDVAMNGEDDYDAAFGDVNDDNWILDDIGGGLQEEDGEKQWAAKEGVREMGKARSKDLRILC